MATHERKKYTVLIPYPKGGGAYAERGSTVDLMDVEALALRQAGRIALTAEVEAKKVASASNKPSAEAK